LQENGGCLSREKVLLNYRIGFVVMREEVMLWWKQALKDLEAAEKNFQIGLYYVSAFLNIKINSRTLALSCVSW